jgi:hypothetical protein
MFTLYLCCAGILFYGSSVQVFKYSNILQYFNRTNSLSLATLLCTQNKDESFYFLSYYFFSLNSLNIFNEKNQFSTE